MDLKRITPTLSVSPQIAPDDMTALKAAGFSAIICNRPDGEDDGQPPIAEVEAAAKSAGLKVIFQPVIPGQISDEDVTAFKTTLGTLSGPAVAYCRTGTRAAKLWAFAQAGQRMPEEILSLAQAAGYDLSDVAPRIEQMAQARA